MEIEGYFSHVIQPVWSLVFCIFLIGSLRQLIIQSKSSSVLIWQEPALILWIQSQLFPVRNIVINISHIVIEMSSHSD